LKSRSATAVVGQVTSLVSKADPKIEPLSATTGTPT